MAMVATGVLHNVGNVLSGVTVSSALMRDKLHELPLDKLRQVAGFLQEHTDSLSIDGADAHQVRALPAFVTRLSEHLQAEQSALLNDAEMLRSCVEHAASVIASQQALAHPGALVRELVSANNLMEAALALSLPAVALRDVEVHRSFADAGSVSVERHKALQILLNLLSNARHALRDSPRVDKALRLSTKRVGNHVCLTVQDNGVGIAPAQLPLVFNRGFTTRPDGHGFGLHLSANWAREMGGTLRCSSDGLGLGASFTLELPALVDGAAAAPASPAAELASN
jgi:signal transduction histidine kinase